LKFLPNCFGIGPGKKALLLKKEAKIFAHWGMRWINTRPKK